MNCYAVIVFLIALTSILLGCIVVITRANRKLKMIQPSLIMAERNAALDRIAKTVGHEVGNPLYLIIGRGQEFYKSEIEKLRSIVVRNAEKFSQDDLNEFLKIADRLNTNIARIIRSGNRIDVVVKTLTHLLKDREGLMRPLSFAVLFREAIETTPFFVEGNRVNCEIEGSISSNVLIMGKLEQLIQVFVCLIKNAYDAMAGQEKPRIEVMGEIDSENPKMARVEFADNGCGIPAHILPQIWLEGFSTKSQKSNLNKVSQRLFDVKHTIESVHKGTIAVESTLGEGTRFFIYLPLADSSSV